MIETVKRPANTVFELCVARMGLLKGTRLAGYVSTWAMASAEMKRPIDAEDYSSFWEESSPATSYRRLAEFRQQFPTLDSPQVIADLAAAAGLPPAQAAHLPLKGQTTNTRAAKAAAGTRTARSSAAA